MPVCYSKPCGKCFVVIFCIPCLCAFFPSNLVPKIFRFGLNLSSGIDVEKRYGVNFMEERKNRAYMEGLKHGVHPLANAAGKGLRTVLRETDCKPPLHESVPRVFV